MPRFSDNGDGTFTNPLLFADYPDPDIIRVGRDFYMVSSSFTCVPGVPVCHSRDLVNWRIIGHACARLPEGNPAYSMQGGEVAYRGGPWAPFIRHRKGKFYVGFCTPSEGFFMAIADDPAGPYELISFGAEFYDPSLLFASDGRVLLSHGANGIFVSELEADARSVKSGPRFVFQTPLGTPLEGSHFYERDGWFFLTMTSRGYNGLQAVLRSRDPFGPYEWRVVSADDMNYAGAGLHQGGFVELEDGGTWFFLFQDRDWVGRVPVLQPVRWEDGWPILGDPQNFGKAVVTSRRPVLPSGPRTVPETSDGFDAPSLGLHWQWNHNPDDSRWSLTERPGWLRLHSAPACDLLHARNTLSQKIPGPAATATVSIDRSHLAPGDRAGLCVLNIPCAGIRIVGAGSHATIEVFENATTGERGSCPAATVILLRAEAREDGTAVFSYSAGDGTFHPIGIPFRMEFTVKTFLGNRFGLFCFSENKSGGGFADFDAFVLETPREDNMHPRGREIRFSEYDAEYGTDTSRVAEKQPTQTVGDLNDGDWVRFHRVDFGTGADRIIVRAAALCGGSLEITSEGKVLGSLTLPSDPAAKPWACTYRDHDVSILPQSGIRPLTFTARGPGRYLFQLESFHIPYP